MRGEAADSRGPDERFAAVVDRLTSPVAVLAADSTLLYLNPAAAHALRHELSWLTGRRMLDLVHPEDRARVAEELSQVVAKGLSSGITRHRIRAGSAGPWQVLESTATNLLDEPAVSGILVSGRDITTQLAQERQLRDAASRDHLTGLANRASITGSLGTLAGKQAPLAVAFLGVDRFNLINHSLGHASGDAVLEVVAARLALALPASAQVGRFAGDVFVVLVPTASERDAVALLWRVIDRLAEPLYVAGHELRLSASAGIAMKDNLATAESLLRDASLALHHAMSEGGRQVRPCTPEMREAAISRIAMEADLRRAIGGPDLDLALQPIVRLEDRKPKGAEALSRWQRSGTAVPPVRFIEVAEETGLIVALGDWVIDRAAQLAPGAPGGTISVNLSARQLASPGLVARIARVLRARDLPPSALAFEITETLLVTEFDFATDVLAEIRGLGCRVGLDDFGTGYSSLGCLSRLPIDFLKIDGTLTAGAEAGGQASAVVRGVLGIAEALGISVVAEGIETETQAAAVRDLGCTLGQGYLFGRAELATGRPAAPLPDR